MKKKMLTILTPCYNEEGNVEELNRQVDNVMSTMPQYDYEHLFIDNASTDSTVMILKRMAAKDQRVKVIVNQRNFGQVRSPYHALMEASGDAVIGIVADFQDPPELISVFVRYWEEGYKIVMGQKIGSKESRFMRSIRSFYYDLVSNLSEVELIRHITGSGLFDRDVIEQLRKLEDPCPYVRGLISELGYPIARVPYEQPLRRSGVTKNNWYTLYDLAMLGFTSHSKVPLRLATIIGFISAVICLFVAIGYLIYKLLYWYSLPVGTAPMVIGIFFFASIQLFFIGIIGEYVGAIHTQVLKRPLVVEKERINL
jgi:glycosyltransferase involved in cell wall biosynthesis